MTFASIIKTENGYAIEFTNNIGEHIGWFTKSDGSIKTWQRIEGAQNTMDKYPWWVR